MKKYLFLLILLIGILSACDKKDSIGENIFVNDDELILAIQNAGDKLVISRDELHYEAKVTLNNEYSENLFEEARFAPDLGYEVLLIEKNGSIAENGGREMQMARHHVYFDKRGKKLRYNKENRDGACFSFIFPITYIMPDDSELTGMDMKEVEKAIKTWYKDNRDTDKRPVLKYPVEVNFKGETLTLSNDQEMRRIRMACAGDKDDGKDSHDDDEMEACFKMVYPLTYLIGDIRISGDTKKEIQDALKNWYRDHPDVKKRPELQFPIQIKYESERGERIVDIADRGALKKAFKDCGS